MSLITEKYEYKKMSRSILEGRRVYQTPDGDKLASVTTILDDTKDKTHLNKWRKKVGPEKAKEITAEATTGPANGPLPTSSMPAVFSVKVIFMSF